MRNCHFDQATLAIVAFAALLSFVSMTAQAQRQPQSFPVEIVSNQGHSDFIQAVALSRDGRLALSGSADR